MVHAQAGTEEQQWPQQSSGEDPHSVRDCQEGEGARRAEGLWARVD